MATERQRQSNRALVWGLLGILALGLGGRLAYVHRPLDHRLVNPWRQSDYFQIARNFYREGMNPLYPRIDWRGDTPGYAEMELPVLPWLGALFYPHLGPRIQVLRVLAAILEIASLLLFAGLARRRLPASGAIFATAAFAVNPLLISLAGNAQPEPLLHLFSLTAMILLWRWYDEPRAAVLFWAAAAAAMAILAKLTALYLGLVFAYAVLRRLRWHAFFDYRIYAAALLAILPAAGWYTWAHRFWIEGGLSLGMSNETHSIGLDMLWPPAFLAGILKWEILGVFSPVGWLLALAALRMPRRMLELPLAWYGAIWILYLASARTSGDNWASYYHAIAAPPVCLLMGGGFAALWSGRALPESWRQARRRRSLASLLAGTCLVALLGVAAIKIYRRDFNSDMAAFYACALEFQQIVPAEGRIVVNGGTMYDSYGQPVAHNESMAFAWMDRKGFNYGAQELAPQTLKRIAARGGRFWIARAGELKKVGIENARTAPYFLLAECRSQPRYYLYDLGRGESEAPDPVEPPPSVSM